MNTLEMMNQAKDTGNFYRVEHLFYSRDKGFIDIYGEPCKHFDINKVLKFSNWGVIAVISKDEKIILQNIDKKYKYITRDKDNCLRVHTFKPYRDNIQWNSDNLSGDISVYQHMFKFVTWSEDGIFEIEELIE